MVDFQFIFSHHIVFNAFFCLFNSHSLFRYACLANISFSWVSFEVITYMDSYELI